MVNNTSCLATFSHYDYYYCFYYYIHPRECNAPQNLNLKARANTPWAEYRWDDGTKTRTDSAKKLRGGKWKKLGSRASR